MALYVDGASSRKDYVVVVALGANREETNHGSGCWGGATGNAATPRAPLEDLVGRGLRMDWTILGLIDTPGSPPCTQPQTSIAPEIAA